MSSEQNGLQAVGDGGVATPRRARQRTPEETARDKKLYLEAVAKTGALIRSADAVPGLTWCAVAHWKQNDSQFAEAVRVAKARFAELLEAEAIRRGAVGVDEPVFYKGKEVATVKRYSDRLLELELKKANPEYREKATVDVNLRGGVLVVPGVIPSIGDWAAAAGAEPEDPAALPPPGSDVDERAERG